MHAVLVEDDLGNLADIREYCSDSCARTDPLYAGWNGTHEVQEGCDIYCTSCGVLLNVLDCGCEHSTVVNLFATDTPKLCPHNGVLQVATI